VRRIKSTKFSGMEKNRRTRGRIVYVEFAYKQKDGYEIHRDADSTVKRRV
jgi:hypothetical protein